MPDAVKKLAMRSAAWFGAQDRDGFTHRAWMRNQGLPSFDGRSVIGICNTWSELTPCNAHFRQLAEHAKRGVWEMGGFPVEFPVMRVLPAVGYGAAQLEALAATINGAETDVVVAAMPIDLARLVRLDKPVIRARYDFAEAGEPSLASVLDQFLTRQ